MTAARWPNFFIAGVPKCGSTALYHHLRQHPQVFMSPVKEPGFFAADDALSDRFRAGMLRALTRQRTFLEALLEGPSNLNQTWRVVMEEEQYLKLFEGVGSEVAVGEASVSYFWLPKTADAIAARVPGARLIFMLRDPANRMFSQYLASSANEPPAPFRQRFLEAVDTGRSHYWIGPGDYATNLGRFLKRFPPEQLRMHLYDDYLADPHVVLRDIFTFLGVDPAFRADVSRRYNEPSLPRFSWLHSLRQRVFGRASLTRPFPRPLRRPISALYHRRRADLHMDPADRQLVIDFYRDEILRTADLIGRDLSAWLR